MVSRVANKGKQGLVGLLWLHRYATRRSGRERILAAQHTIVSAQINFIPDLLSCDFSKRKSAAPASVHPGHSVHAWINNLVSPDNKDSIYLGTCCASAFWDCICLWQSGVDRGEWGSWYGNFWKGDYPSPIIRASHTITITHLSVAQVFSFLEILHSAFNFAPALTIAVIII